MALNVCAACTTAFAVGLAQCPHCRSTDFAEQGQDMPKITEHGGPSNARAEVTLTDGVRMAGEWEPATEAARQELEEGTAELLDAMVIGEGDLNDWQPTGVAALDGPEPDAEGGDQSSPGSSSQTSSETPPSKPEPSEPDPPKPARATGSRSKRARTGPSTASGTATAGPETATSPDPE